MFSALLGVVRYGNCVVTNNVLLVYQVIPTVNFIKGKLSWIQDVFFANMVLQLVCLFTNYSLERLLSSPRNRKKSSAVHFLEV